MSPIHTPPWVRPLLDRLTELEQGKRMPRARVERETNQSIPNSTPTDVTFTLRPYDTFDAWDGASGLVIPEPGIYAMAAYARFAGNTTGSRDLWLGSIAQTAFPTTTNPVHLAVSDESSLAAGDVVSLFVIQSSGSSLNLTRASLAIRRVA